MEHIRWLTHCCSPQETGFNQLPSHTLTVTLCKMCKTTQINLKFENMAFFYGLELIFHSDCFILYFILRTVPYTYFIHNEPRSNTESSCYLWFFVITVKMKWTEIFICQECPDPRAWGLQTSQASGDQSGRIPGEESWENAATALTRAVWCKQGTRGVDNLIITLEKISTPSGYKMMMSFLILQTLWWIHGYYVPVFWRVYARSPALARGHLLLSVA